MELPPVFDDIADRIRTTVQEKPAVFAASAGLTVLLLIAVIIVLVQTRPQKQAPAPQAPAFTADAPLFTPDAPAMAQDYYPSRIPGKVWSGEDIEEWFTLPDDSTIGELEKANDKIVSDIIGAAP